MVESIVVAFMRTDEWRHYLMDGDVIMPSLQLLC